MQQTLELAAVAGGTFSMPFSLPSRDALPRWTIHTLFCASVDTPVIDPMTHESSLKGCGHSGTTRYAGAPCAMTVG